MTQIKGIIIEFHHKMHRLVPKWHDRIAQLVNIRHPEMYSQFDCLQMGKFHEKIWVDSASSLNIEALLSIELKSM